MQTLALQNFSSSPSTESSGTSYGPIGQTATSSSIPSSELQPLVHASSKQKRRVSIGENTRISEKMTVMEEKLKTRTLRAEENAATVFLYYRESEYAHSLSAPPPTLLQCLKRDTHNIIVAVQQTIVSYYQHIDSFHRQGDLVQQSPTIAHVVMSEDYDLTTLTVDDFKNGLCPFISVIEEETALRELDVALIPADSRPIKQEGKTLQFALDTVLYQQEITQHLLEKMRAALMSHHQTLHKAFDLEVILALPGMGNFSRLFGESYYSMTHILAPLAANAFKVAFEQFVEEQKNANLTDLGRIVAIRLVQPTWSRDVEKESERTAIDEAFFPTVAHQDITQLGLSSPLAEARLQVQRRCVIGNNDIVITAGAHSVENFTQRNAIDLMPVLIVPNNAGPKYLAQPLENDVNDVRALSPIFRHSPSLLERTSLLNPAMVYQMNSISSLVMGTPLTNTYASAQAMGHPSAAELVGCIDTFAAYLSPDSSIATAIAWLEKSIGIMQTELNAVNETLCRYHAFLSASDVPYDVKIATLIALLQEKTDESIRNFISTLVERLKEGVWTSCSPNHHVMQLTHALYQMRRMRDLPMHYSNWSREYDLTDPQFTIRIQDVMADTAHFMGVAESYFTRDSSGFKPKVESILENIKSSIEHTSRRPKLPKSAVQAAPDEPVGAVEEVAHRSSRTSSR
jgi:hypothetical protein